MKLDYQRKYLKYKQKYLQLINQIAGNSDFEIGDIISYQGLNYQVILKDESHISIRQINKDDNSTQGQIITFSLENDQEKINKFKKFEIN